MATEPATRSITRRKVARISPKVAGGLFLAAALTLPLACGDDDDSSDTAAVCDSRDDLQASVQALGNVDILRQGTNGLEEAADDVRDALDHVQQAAQDEYGDQVDAVQSALSNLGDALGSFSDQGSASAGVSSVTDAATQLKDAVATLTSDLRDQCN